MLRLYFIFSDGGKNRFAFAAPLPWPSRAQDRAAFDLLLQFCGINREIIAPRMRPVRELITNHQCAIEHDPWKIQAAMRAGLDLDSTERRPPDHAPEPSRQPHLDLCQL